MDYNNTFTQEKYMSHIRWLAGEPDQERLCMSGGYLCHANLSGADLSSANLCDVNLSGANLICTNLSGANLIGANLSGANLIGANLSGANLDDANLDDANLSNVNLLDAKLAGCRINNLSCGNNAEIKTLQLGKYQTVIDTVNSVLSVGCATFTFLEWESFDDCEIERMDTGALAWRNANKQIILELIKRE